MSEPETNESWKSKALENKIDRSTRRPYTAPKVLSAEPLEATAALCPDFGGGNGTGFGKNLGPFGCATLGT